MLCGYPPFRGRTEEELLRKIVKGTFSFDPEEWSEISAEAKSLISKMLNVDPDKRISAKDALNDPWVTSQAPNKKLNAKFMNNFSKFCNDSKMKNAILSFICIQLLTNQEKEEMLDVFKALDSDNDGRLSKEELYQGYMKQGNDSEASKEIVERIFKAIDSNKSGSVDFTEFLVANIEQTKSLNKQKMEQAFKMFDTDGNGFITKEELLNIFGGVNIDETTMNQLMSEIDKNGDQKINFQEFTELLSRKFD